MHYISKRNTKFVVGKIIKRITNLQKFDVDYFVEHYNTIFNTVCENKSYPHKTCECGYRSLNTTSTDDTCPICHSHINFTDSKLSDYIMLSPDISDFMELYRLQWIQENRLQ